MRRQSQEGFKVSVKVTRSPTASIFKLPVEARHSRRKAAVVQPKYTLHHLVAARERMGTSHDSDDEDLD